MEIRNNILGSSGPDPIDLTKANRDSIRERNPNPPAPPKTVEGDELVLSDPKRVKKARDQWEQHAASVQKRVEEARDRFHVHKRVKEARGRFEAAPEDKFTLSDSGQGLADTTIRPSVGDVNVAVRTQRVAELKAQFENGQLDVDSLVAEAAHRMLSGD